MLLDASQSQLVLVDYQARLMPAIFEAEAAVKNAVRLGKIARLMEVPVWGTEENPTRLGENLPEIRALCQRTLAKMRLSDADRKRVEAMTSALVKKLLHEPVRTLKTPGEGDRYVAAARALFDLDGAAADPPAAGDPDDAA